MVARKANTENENVLETFIENVLLFLGKSFGGKLFGSLNAEGIAIKTIPGSIIVFVDANKYEICTKANVLSIGMTQAKVAKFSCADFEAVYQLIWSLKKKDCNEGIETFPQFKEVEYKKIYVLPLS